MVMVMVMVMGDGDGDGAGYSGSGGDGCCGCFGVDHRKYHGTNKSKKQTQQLPWRHSD
jgi:hypothetical protein